MQPKRFHLSSHIKRFRSRTQKLELHTKQIVPCENTAEEVSFEWSHNRISSTDSKVRTTYLTNSTMRKVLLRRGFIQMAKEFRLRTQKLEPIYNTLHALSRVQHLILLFNPLFTSLHTSSDRVKISFRRLSCNFETATVFEETGRSAV